MNRAWTAIIASAVLFALALHIPNLYWLIFVFLIPIFFKSMSYNFFFKHGFVWGLIFYGTHFSALFFSVSQLTHNIYALMLPLLVILYFSLLSGLWISLTARLLCRFTKPIARLVGCFLGAFIFSTWLHVGSLFWIRLWCGYGPVYPLVALAQDSRFFCNLPSWLLLMCLLLGQAGVAYALYVKKNKFLFITLFFFTPFFVGFFNKGSHPPLLPTSVRVERVNVGSAAQEDSPFDRAQKIQNALNALAIRSTSTIIILGESAFPYPLNKEEFSLVTGWWLPLHKNVHILLGSQRMDEGCLYNTMYYIREGKIIDWYDKQRLVPFVEYIPFGFALNKEASFSLAAGRSNKIFTLDGVEVEPLICSDLFFNSGNSCKAPIVFIENIDTYFPDYFKRVLQHFISFRSRANPIMGYS